MEYDKQIRYNDSQMERYQAYISKVQKINRLDKRTKKMTIGDVIKKSILPLAFMVFWFWMTKTIMKVSGQTDWFWWIFIAGLPFGIHKMRLILIPRGMDTTATLGMAALSVIIGALIGSIMIPVYVIRAIYVFIRYIIER
jgi:phosphoglycerol transferase MdoB-like AlkP superfamily enzyme